MAYDPAYTDCMSRRPESGAGAELVLLQWVRTGNWRLPAGLAIAANSGMTELRQRSKVSRGGGSQDCPCWCVVSSS